MKESKFIELLNLYIDQQISPAEAAELEKEILQNAQRRRTYRQYCRMHHACTLVFENFRSQAEPPAAGASRPAGELVELEANPRRFAWGYYAAGLAAAACVALVAMQSFRRTTPSAASSAAATRPAEVLPAASVAAAPVHMDAAVPVGYHRQTETFVAQQLVFFSPTDSHNSASLVIVAGRDPVRPLSVARAAPRNPRPSIEQFVFEPPATGNDNAPLRIRQSTDSQAEMAAYQFQR